MGQYEVTASDKRPHLFQPTEPFEVEGTTIRWMSQCGRSYTGIRPLPAPKGRKPCRYCADLPVEE